MSWTIRTEHRLLDAPTLERMHAAAVAILARTGLRVDHDEIREQIARRGGFALRDGRVRITPERLDAWKRANDEHSRRQRAADEPAEDASPDDWICGTDNRAMFVVARDGRTVRPSTRDDTVATAKLLAALNDRGVRGSTACVPMDVPAALQPVEQFLIAAEHSPGGGRTSFVTTLAQAKIVREMDRVYGRPLVQSVYCPSPLALGGPDLDACWHFRDDVAAAFVGSMPMMGVTGPCDPVAVFVLSLAECIGSAAILSELLPGVGVQIAPHPEPADMRTGNMVFGTPEWELLDLLHRDVYAFYGQRRDGKLLHTAAPVPGPEAMLDHATSATTGMLLGYRAFGGVGQLSLDEAFSAAMLMLDLDVLAHAARVARGAETGRGLALDGLADVVDETIREAAMFAEHPTTAANLRRQYHEPDVMRRLSLRQWQAAGRPEAARDAQAAADRLIDDYEYDPPADILRDLRAIARRARDEL